jgi:hypothetical protein
MMIYKKSDEGFATLCRFLREENGNIDVLTVANDDNRSITIEDIRCDKQTAEAWRGFLRVVVRRYLLSWKGDARRLHDDMREIIKEYQKESSMDAV